MQQIQTINFKHLHQPHWTELEYRNAKNVVCFMQNLMNNHDFEYVLHTCGNLCHIQHKRSIPVRISELINHIKKITKRSPEYAYDVKAIHVDGEYVIVHSHVTARKKDRGNQKRGLLIIDKWRVVEGQLVGHWAIIQPIDLLMKLSLFFGGDHARNFGNLF